MFHFANIPILIVTISDAQLFIGTYNMIINIVHSYCSVGTSRPTIKTTNYTIVDERLYTAIVDKTSKCRLSEGKGKPIVHIPTTSISLLLEAEKQYPRRRVNRFTDVI